MCCALLAAACSAPLAPRAAAHGARMCDSYWQSKASRLQVAFSLDEAMLQEMEEREAILLERLQTAADRNSALLAELAAARETSVSAPSLPAPATPVGDDKTVAQVQAEAESSGAFLLTKLSEVQAEADALREKLAEAEIKQQLTAASAPSALGIDGGGAAKGSALEAAQARIGQLELEIDGLEEDYEALTERLEVQAETITLANGRLDEVAEALQSQALQAERQLQQTAAFWIQRVTAARLEAAEAPRLRAALSAAEQRLESATRAQALQAERALQSVAAFWIAREQQAKRGAASAAPTGPANPSEGALPDGELEELAAREASARAQVKLLAAQLEARALQAERQLQSTGAFWIGQLATARAEAAAALQQSAAAEAAQRALAELRSKESLASPGAAPAKHAIDVLELQASLIDLYEEALATATMTAEVDLQKCSAFWIARERDQRDQLTHAKRENAELRALLEATRTTA